MTENQTPHTGSPQERKRRDYAALVDSLADTLDLHGGLAEALDVAGYTAMRSHLAHLLNLEAGLRSALAAHHGTEQPRELGAATSVAELLPRAGPRESGDLLARASDDDSTAWEELIHRYGSLVRSTVASFRLQEADAQEAVQNTWLRVMERMDTIRDPQRLGGWLATTASRECLVLIRRRHQKISEDVAGKQPVTTEEEPNATVVTSEAHRPVLTVAELTRRRQELIQHLFYPPDASYAEVSQATGMPQGTIGPTRRRLLRELQEALEQRRFHPQSRADVAEEAKGDLTEGDRTGSYLLDNLRDEAERALREKVTDFRTGATQSTGYAQRDDLPQKADTALRAALHDQETTASEFLPVISGEAGIGKSAVTAAGLLAHQLPWMAWLEWLDGNWTAALALADEAVELAPQTGWLSQLPHNLSILARIEAGFGMPSCREHAKSALAGVHSGGNPATTVHALAAIGLLELGLDHPNDAAEVLQQAWDAARPQVARNLRLQILPDLVTAYARASLRERATEKLAQLDDLAARTGHSWARAAAAHCHGLLEPRDFAERFEDALHWHDRGSTLFDRARTHFAYGTRLHRGRNRAGARVQLQQALELFEHLGAAPWAERTRDKLVSNGESTPNRSERIVQQLTPQELRVALTIQRGLSNADAAAALFLSIKTIEYHLSNVYHKLGINSRTQLIRALSEGLPHPPW